MAPTYMISHSNMRLAWQEKSVGLHELSDLHSATRHLLSAPQISPPQHLPSPLHLLPTDPQVLRLLHCALPLVWIMQSRFALVQHCLPEPLLQSIFTALQELEFFATVAASSWPPGATTGNPSTENGKHTRR